MNDKIKNAFKLAAFGIGVVGTPLGVYWGVDAATTEFITHKQEYDQAKACVANLKDNLKCPEADYPKVALYVDTKKQYAKGLSWGFGGMSLIRAGLPPVVAFRRRKKEQKNEKRA